MKQHRVQTHAVVAVSRGMAMYISYGVMAGELPVVERWT